MATIKVKQTKSRIKCPKDQKRTLDALGLKKMNQVVEHEATPAILGMVEKVKHLVSIEIKTRSKDQPSPEKDSAVVRVQD